jgi:CheY-like chemotaxis protein
MNNTVAKHAKTILVVDDNPIVLRVISGVLEKNGYRVLTAETGAETISLLHKNKPDLILLDVDFPPDINNVGGPFRDGFLIIDWARRMFNVEKIPVFIISSFEPKVYKSRAESFGILKFFQKPIDNKELLHAIKVALWDAPPSA